MVKTVRKGRDNIETKREQREQNFVFWGGKRSIKPSKTFRSRPDLSLLRIPYNVQLKWTSNSKKSMVKTFKKGAEEEKRERKSAFLAKNIV